MSMSNVEQPATRIDDVRFGRQWQKIKAGQRVRDEMPGWRALGTAVALTPAGRMDGVLVRSIKLKSYRVVGESASVDLDTGHTDLFLQTRRRGHHGGPGRAQGPLSVDGRAYTRRFAVSLAPSVVEQLVERGDGVMSLGLRRLAAVVARRVKERPDSIPADLAARVKHDSDEARQPARVYIDSDSYDALRTLGSGNLSRGIRFAAWLSTHRR